MDDCPLLDQCPPGFHTKCPSSEGTEHQEEGESLDEYRGQYLLCWNLQHAIEKEIAT